jgi:hypothetical protein
MTSGAHLDGRPVLNNSIPEQVQVTIAFVARAGRWPCRDPYWRDSRRRVRRGGFAGDCEGWRNTGGRPPVPHLMEAPETADEIEGAAS